MLNADALSPATSASNSLPDGSYWKDVDMNILLLGSGGREHALAWKLAQSQKLTRLYAAPGNPGIARHAELVDLDATDHGAVVAFCKPQTIGLVRSEEHTSELQSLMLISYAVFCLKKNILQHLTNQY